MLKPDDIILCHNDYFRRAQLPEGRSPVGSSPHSYFPSALFLWPVFSLDGGLGQESSSRRTGSGAPGAVVLRNGNAVPESRPATASSSTTAPLSYLSTQPLSAASRDPSPLARRHPQARALQERAHATSMTPPVAPPHPNPSPHRPSRWLPAIRWWEFLQFNPRCVSSRDDNFNQTAQTSSPTIERYRPVAKCCSTAPRQGFLTATRVSMTLRPPRAITTLPTHAGHANFNPRSTRP